MGISSLVKQLMESELPLAAEADAEEVAPVPSPVDRLRGWLAREQGKAVARELCWLIPLPGELAARVNREPSVPRVASCTGGSTNRLFLCGAVAESGYWLLLALWAGCYGSRLAWTSWTLRLVQWQRRRGMCRLPPGHPLQAWLQVEPWRKAPVQGAS
jgi:hypothetical protein